MRYLKANTQVKVVVGPFVDVSDGFTPETGIALSTADEAELVKHDAAAVTDISGATWAAITSMDGYYNLTLTTSHTDTEGMLVIAVQDDSECLPVRQEFMVLAEAAYDSMFVAKDTGFMDVDVKAISGDTTAADNAELMFDGTGYAGGTTKLDVNIASTDDIDLSATQKASVNTEVDNALNVTTYAEPGQENPAATTTLVNKIGYLYKVFRNRKTQTTTQWSLYADDGTTVDQKSTISDDGTTFDKTEVATGP